jgi:hypothetical protein
VIRAASSSRALTFSTSKRRFSIASKRVRYPLTSRAMMSNSLNSEPRNADRFYPADPARAGPAVKLHRLRLLASRATARWWVAGFGERSGRSRLRRPGRRRQRRPSARRRPRAASRDPSRLPRSFAGRSRARRQDLKMLQDARTQRWARSHSDGGLSAAKTIATSVSLFQ